MDERVLKNAARMFSSETKTVSPVGGVMQNRPEGRGLITLWSVLCAVILSLCGQNVIAGDADPSSVQLAWNPSPDTSVVGYRVHYGVATEQYTNSIVVGNVTSTTISGLVNGTTYFFAITAYDASGMQSPFSNEISYAVAYSQLQVRANAARQMILTVAGQVGHVYAIEATQDLTTWTTIGSATAGAGGTVDFIDANAASFVRRFYRLRDTTP